MGKRCSQSYWYEEPSMGWSLLSIYTSPGDIVDVSNKQLPTTDIVVNMDGGVGGSWKEVEYIDINGQSIPIQQLPPK